MLAAHPFAHPLAGSQPLPVPPLVLAAVTVVLAALVATRVRAATAPSPAPPTAPSPAPPTAPAQPPPAPGAAPPAGPRWLAATRLAAAALLLYVVAVARFGDDREPRNLAAVAATHVLWPLLLAAAALAGPLLWRAVDPWYALGSVERLLSTPPRPPTGDPPVWPAVVTGGAWAAFAGWYALSVDPRALAVMLAAYTLAMLAGALALGRARWLPRADALGLLTTWTGLIRRGRLTSWVPPPGAAALLGAVFGGVTFTRLRLSSAWTRVAATDHALLWHRAGAVAAVLLGAVLAVAAERWAARRGAPGSVAAALVPVVAATAVALPLRRFMVAAQLLPQLARVAERRVVDLNPWGTGVQQGLAVAIVALGALAGAWVVARRVRGVRARDPAALAVYVTSFAAVLLATAR